MKNNERDYIIFEGLSSYAKTLSCSKNSILSAENYLLAVVNVLTGEPVPSSIFPYGFNPIPKDIAKELSAMCECYNISLLDTKKRLQPAIKSFFDPVLDEHNMDNMLEKHNDIYARGLSQRDRCF